MDGGIHAGALCAPFFFSWSGLILCMVLYSFIAFFGITLCLHRLLSHRSFDTPRPVRYILVLISCCSMEGNPIEWVGTHRRHHSTSDTSDDPHTPLKGLLWAHMGWIFHDLSFDYRRYAKDLLADPWIRAIDRTFWIPPLILLIALYVFGEVLFGLGWSWVFWGGCVRGVLVYHVTWIVNSWTHRWGYRNFETTDHSTNSPIVAFLTAGEGWHNNHHAFPRSASHGMFKGEFDLTYQVIRLMEKLGLAWDVVHPSRYPLAERSIRHRASNQEASA